MQNEVIDDKSTQSKVKVKRKKNISPSPPSKGGGRKKSEPKEINSKARFIFESHFKQVFGNDYYWTARDAGAMSQLLQKLRFQREQKQLDISDESILYALQYLLSSIKEGWIFENFSVTNINSKFNEIVSQAKSKYQRKPSPSIVLTDNSTEKYNTPEERKWEERWKQ